MSAPVCITGMHRSGTSLMAMLLHACGLHIGLPRDFAPADEDNRLGYWEDLRFLRINDRILRRAGGTWDRPPERPVGPPGTGLFDRALRFRARRLIREAARSGPWGWKDPRTALTLPFWTALLPELKVVICLRHPAEVDASLRRRTHWRSARGAELWRIYNERLLAAVPRERRIIVSNAAVAADPASALRPVLAFLGLPPERAERPEVAALVRPELRCSAGASASHLGAETEALYRAMLAESA